MFPLEQSFFAAQIRVMAVGHVSAHNFYAYWVFGKINIQKSLVFEKLVSKTTSCYELDSHGCTTNVVLHQINLISVCTRQSVFSLEQWSIKILLLFFAKKRRILFSISGLSLQLGFGLYEKIRFTEIPSVKKLLFSNWDQNCFILSKHFYRIAPIKYGYDVPFYWIMVTYLQIQWNNNDTRNSRWMNTYWRRSWCNDYRRRKWTQRPEFKSWTRLFR